jgi:hypothetical protein
MTMQARKCRIVAAAVVAFAAQAAQAAQAATGAPASEIPAGVHRIPPDRLAHYWLLDPDSAQGRAPNAGFGLDAATCVAVSYMVEKSGTTSHVKLERAVPPGPLAKVAFNVVAGMRFAAAAQNPGKDAVYTYVVIPFNLPDPASASPAERTRRAAVLAPCDLPEFRTDR